MAYIDHKWGSSYVVQLGDGATPTEVFKNIAVINNSKAITGTAETATAQVRDLDDPGAVMKTVAKVTSTTTTITGSGQVHPIAMLPLWNLFYSGAIRNMKFSTVGMTGAQGGIIHSGKYVLTNLQVTAETDSLVECDLTFSQADAVSVAAAS